MVEEEPTTPRIAEACQLPIDERAVQLLRVWGPLTCSMLGELLWGKSDKPGTAPYARAAGRVLHRLERAHRVCRRRDDHRVLWSLILKSGQPFRVEVKTR